MKPLNILWLAAHPHPRANEAGAPWVVSLIRQLAARPAEVALTVLGVATGLPVPVEHYEEQGVRYIYLNTPERREDIRTLFRRRVALLRAYVQAHGPAYDLIHVHGCESQLHVATAGLAMPVLLSMQGIVWENLKLLPEISPIRRFLWLLASYYELRYLPQVRDTSCRTTWDAAMSRRFNPACRVHHNWEMIRPAFFELDCAATPGPEPGRPHLLFVGGSQTMKGYRQVLEAFDLIRQQVPAKLTIVGQTEPEVVQQHIKRKKLTAIGPDDLELRGMQNTAALQALMQESFCLLHPSYLDNSPNTVCEAQVAGLPVVVTLVGGVGSLVTHERTGLGARLDPRDIADQVLRLCRDEPLRQRLSRQAMRVARARHDPATITQRTLDIYRTMLARERLPEGAEIVVAAAELQTAEVALSVAAVPQLP
ncbi:glycosyltransferase family 4 protein [Hymenobacter sp. H14-R3]|uniref:glycosyltransferase family 4 protein n=1 Tax=Hymenobacter sp. H14-R3 TaxID=3046308 RepID=UPI0024BAEA8C|nr:glycosyltransferase family 4 protein [Hymenobacter sp. H14-R3]MDJ0367188.1 glycosyltransferase family 4 protein [Hymenobacter sp. H14-R3]